MTGFLKKISFVLLCLVMVLPTIASASSNNGNKIVSALDESVFYDAAGNLIEVLEESDGTIVVYINGVLDHSAKTDLNTGTVESTQYIDATGKKDKQSVKANGKKEINKDKIGMQEVKTIYNIADLIEEADVYDTVADVSEKVKTESLLSTTAYDPIYNFPPTWPYNQGYSYRNTYNNDQRQMLAHGYYKNDSPTYYSSQKVSFVKSTTIGVAVSLLIAVIGGPLTAAIVTGAIVGAVVSYIIDGAFSQNVDVNVHIKVEWENWLAIVIGNSYYTKQGTEYLRVLNANGPGESTTQLPGKVGFIFDFTEFLRQSSWN